MPGALGSRLVQLHSWVSYTKMRLGLRLLRHIFVEDEAPVAATRISFLWPPRPCSVLLPRRNCTGLMLRANCNSFPRALSRI